MRSLNRSLPAAHPSRSTPPKHLLQAFKQAALSVTNLYKAAATEQDDSRQAGYQDALEDLLEFLDRENLGLQDGEGWRVRQWATEHYDGGTNHQHGDSDGESSHSDQRHRTNSPVPESSADCQSPAMETQSQEPSILVSHGVSKQQGAAQPQAQFQFAAGSIVPAENAMQMETQPSMQVAEPPPPRAESAPVRVGVISRGNRPAPRQINRHSSKSVRRESSLNRGHKRKYPFPDLTDIFNVGLDNKLDASGEGNSSSKRGRIV